MHSIVMKINFSDILFIEGLKDYSILQLEDQRVITKMNLKNIHEQLPAKQFLRINKSYIVNTSRIDSFDTNDIFIKSYEIGIGSLHGMAWYKKNKNVKYWPIFIKKMFCRKKKERI